MNENQNQNSKNSYKSVTNKTANKKQYEDIIDLPHYHAPNQPYMSMRDRAAQFTPFKSLNNYSDHLF